MKRADFEREPCQCGECVQAGVSDKRQLRDPQTGQWLHGYDLRRCFDAADLFMAEFKQLLASKAIGR